MRFSDALLTARGPRHRSRIDGSDRLITAARVDAPAVCGASAPDPHRSRIAFPQLSRHAPPASAPRSIGSHTGPVVEQRPPGGVGSSDAVHTSASGSARPRDLVVVVPAVPACLPEVRARVRAWLGEQQDWADDVELAVNEAVANVIDHAYLPGAAGPASLHAWITTNPPHRGRRIVIAVTDRGRWAAHQPDTHPQHARGHGLAVMGGCMDEMHIQRSVAGTTVTLIRAEERSDQPPQ